MRPTEAPLRSIVIVAGPTASGKTALASLLCEALNAEVVSADSIQLYRRLDIGSAKASLAERAKTPHHLIDVADIGEDFDAARYAAEADRAIELIISRGKRALVVGGAGLYLRSLLYGLAPGIESDEAIRAVLNARAAEGHASLARMHDELTKVDPAYAEKVAKTDPIRVVRGLEVYEKTGVALSEHHARHAAMAPRYRARYLAIDVEREKLRPRVVSRTRTMLREGLLDEVRSLRETGVDMDAKPLRSVGYAEAVAHVRSAESGPTEKLEEAIVNSTMAFAKRQRTWFRGERGVRFESAEVLASDAHVDSLRRWYEGDG